MMGVFWSFLLHWSFGCIFCLCVTNLSLLVTLGLLVCLQDVIIHIFKLSGVVEPFQNITLQQEYEGLTSCQSLGDHGKP